MKTASPPAVWFPTVHTGTGTDVSTQRLVKGLMERGVSAEIAWLPLRAEYAPWTVPVPNPPEWATVAHVNTWLHPRFLPKHLPIVLTLRHSVHDPALRPYKGFARAAYHRWWIAPNERAILRRADSVVAVSQFVADTARQTLMDVPIEVIYNGVDSERLRPGRRTRKPGEPFRLLYVGSWIRRKGVDLLAPIMRELGNGFELRYTGGRAAASCRTTAPANMHDLGRLSVDGVISAMQDADAFLFPSRSEGLPLVAIEAMACGLPVIAMRASSLVEVVDDGVTGVLCAHDSVTAFAAAIRHLARESTTHASMSAQARTMAVHHFSIDAMLDRYLRIYREALTRGTRDSVTSVQDCMNSSRSE